MKKIILFCAVSLLATFNIANAQLTFVTNGMAAGLRSVVPNACVLTSLQASGTTNMILRFYDGAPTNVVGAYTNYTSFITNQVRTFVGVNGITNNYTNTLLYTLAQAQAQTTNNTAPLLTLNIGANVAPFEFDTPMIFTKYLNVSNDQGGANLVINYHLP